MNEELTVVEKREMEISEFLREFASAISEKFTKQKDLIDAMGREVSSIKNEDIFELKRSIDDLKEKINSLDEKIPKEERISKDIPDSLRRKLTYRVDNMVEKIEVENWPVESGRYFIGDKKSCIGVCTLSSLDIELPMEGIAIAGKCVTENIGMEKIINNIISNPNIRYLLLCGVEPKGHYVGQAFLCLKEKGLDENKRIIGARGAMPFLKNLNQEQIDHFKNQVEIIDMIEEENAEKIMERIRELNNNNPGAFNAKIDVDCIETIVADYDYEKEDTADSGLDNSFFTILIDKKNKQIVVEHYTGQEKKLNKRIVGKKAEEIIGTIVRLGLVKGLYHSAYLGKELKKAEIALLLGKDYEQDKELMF